MKIEGKLYASGDSMTAIAKKLGISVTAVRKRLIKQNVRIKSSKEVLAERNRRLMEHIAELKKHDPNMTWTQISAKLKISVKSLLRHRNANKDLKYPFKPNQSYIGHGKK